MKVRNISRKLKTKLLVQNLIKECNSGNSIALGEVNGQTVGISIDSNSRNGNVLVIGGAGTGKSYNHIVGNIMRMKHSAIVIAPCGWIEAEYKNAFSEMGYAVYSLDVKDEKCTDYVEEAVAGIRKQKGIVFISGSNLNMFEDYREEIKKLIECLFGNFICNDKAGEYISVYFDDISLMPVVDGLEHYLFLSLSPAFNTGITVVAQCFSQLRYLYQSKWEEIAGLCDTVLVTGNNLMMFREINDFTKIINENLPQSIKAFNVKPEDFSDCRSDREYKNFVSIQGEGFVILNQLNPKKEMLK